MLNGVGGRTIAEAKARMSYVEARTWFAYIKKNGPLNVGRKLEATLEYHLAQVCTVVNRSQGGKAQMEDFMPSVRREKAEAIEATPQNVFALFQGIAAGNKKRMH